MSVCPSVRRSVTRFYSRNSEQLWTTTLNNSEDASIGQLLVLFFSWPLAVFKCTQPKVEILEFGPLFSNLYMLRMSQNLKWSKFTYWTLFIIHFIHTHRQLGKKWDKKGPKCVVLNFGYLNNFQFALFLDAPRISIRGCVRPLVRWSIGPSVTLL